MLSTTLDKLTIPNSGLSLGDKVYLIRHDDPTNFDACHYSIRRTPDPDLWGYFALGGNLAASKSTLAATGIVTRVRPTCAEITLDYQGV